MHRKPTRPERTRAAIWRLATRRVMVGHGVIAGLFAVAFGLLAGWGMAQ